MEEKIGTTCTCFSFFPKAEAKVCEYENQLNHSKHFLDKAESGFFSVASRKCGPRFAISEGRSGESWTSEGGTML